MRLLHVENPDGGGPGVFGDVAAFESWRAWESPPPPDDYDAIVLYGASTNVVQADELPWLRAELDWVRERLDAGVPTLGLCFGAQLMAAALGGAVTRTNPEIGWHEVVLNDAGRLDPVIGALPSRFTACQWHSWQFSVPNGGELLATSAAGAQAVRFGERAWGVQFHPEVDRATYARWIDHHDEDPDAVALGFDPAVEHRRLDELADEWNDLGRRLFAAFLAAIG